MFLDWFGSLFLAVVFAGWTWSWIWIWLLVDLGMDMHMVDSGYWGARTEGSIVCPRGYVFGVL